MRACGRELQTDRQPKGFGKRRRRSINAFRCMACQIRRVETVEANRSGPWPDNPMAMQRHRSTGGAPSWMNASAIRIGSFVSRGGVGRDAVVTDSKRGRSSQGRGLGNRDESSNLRCHSPNRSVNEPAAMIRNHKPSRWKFRGSDDFRLRLLCPTDRCGRMGRRR
ncbi:hypothetical protein V7x_17380 [Crateriforma conspicua]|uniref:Uncharacterized protein n=1 Tax=Crateriforma conspicua TaxID=2527996 RepID=A0A5C6FXX5_9PLAN|nr:hypothetical protein V7x_17380 [Crateriforma conspicua]